MSIAIICGLIAMVGYGLASLFSTYASRQTSPLVSSVWVYAFCVLLAYSLWPANYFPVSHVSPHIWLLLLTLALFVVLATFLQNYAMTHGNASVHSAIVGSNSAFVVLLLVAVLGERLTGLQWVAMSITFLGALLCSINPQQFRTARIGRGTGAAIGAAVLFGVANALQKHLIDQTNWLFPTITNVTIGLIILLLIARSRGTKLIPTRGKINLFWYGAIVAVAGAVEYYGYGVGPASIVAVLLSANIVVFAIIARFKLRDRITHLQQVGIGVTFIGIALLGVLGR